ncbi:hypothetical protein LguiB_028365 [Lonicera macranthoides]
MAPPRPFMPPPLDLATRAPPMNMLLETDDGFSVFAASDINAILSSNEKVKFAYSTNIRKLVNPPLPVGYLGNVCVPMYAQLSANDLLHLPIWKTAQLIKNSKKNMNDEYVRSFIDFQDINYANGITAGKRVSGFTDWRHLGHSTLFFHRFGDRFLYLEPVGDFGVIGAGVEPEQADATPSLGWEVKWRND